MTGFIGSSTLSEIASGAVRRKCSCKPMVIPSVPIVAVSLSDVAVTVCHCWNCGGAYLRAGNAMLICGPCYRLVLARRTHLEKQRACMQRFRRRRDEREAMESPFDV